MRKMPSENKIVALAPLAGYSDKAFREISSLFGSDFQVTEMASSEGLRRDIEKTKILIEPYSENERLSIQLFGSDPSSFVEASKMLRDKDCITVDLNAGCPVNKVVKSGAGAALMKDIGRAKEIVHIIKEESGKKVSVKFRLGWDRYSLNYLEFAEEMVKSGASLLTLHSRTREMGYSGKADRASFRLLKETIGDDALVFASGDIFTPLDAIETLNESNADGVMVARGAIGNPFIFSEIKALLRGKEAKAPTLEEKIETALRHYSLMERYYGKERASIEMRKTMVMYIKGERGARKIKEELVRGESREDFERALEKLKDVSPTDK